MSLGVFFVYFLQAIFLEVSVLRIVVGVRFLHERGMSDDVLEVSGKIVHPIQPIPLCGPDSGPTPCLLRVSRRFGDVYPYTPTGISPRKTPPPHHRPCVSAMAVPLFLRAVGVGI